ncbi:hypothetical protein HDU79_000396 [Rhizoclosmatium sp. JEL0117]|nr:hypothetical protein HDU79_000396 [Rhizoclosmatium sp. JEL0117]
MQSPESQEQRLYKNYDTTLENVSAALARDGVATIPGVISQEDCEHIRARIFSELEAVTKNRFQFENPATWQQLRRDMNSLHRMLMQNYRLGHMQPIWDLRQTPSVVACFAKLWNVNPEDLITSFDGLSVLLPEPGKPYTAIDTFKLHLDQGKGSRGLESYQGFITLYPVTENDATLNVLEGSHELHDAYFKAHPNESSFALQNPDFYATKTRKSTKTIGCPNTYVLASAGSLVLWDSRTVHRGSAPALGHTPTTPRMVVYICMTPRAKASPAMMQKRIRVFEGLRMTGHLPHRVKMFGEEPRFRARPMTDFDLVGAPVLGRLGRRLVGYDEEEEELVKNEEDDSVEEAGMAKKIRWARIDDDWE